jgi:mRNA interferase RelE/StbE
LAWKIDFEQDAIRQLNRLDKSVRHRIIEYLELRLAASADPRKFGKPLRGDKSGLWSYRVGDFRVICLLEHHGSVIVVVSVGHRRDVYR